jgi:hypothetical protein
VDIRTIEKYLTDTGFRLDTRVSVSGFDSDDERLAWTEFNDTWRLVHCSQDEENAGWYIKPLIETAVSTRWRVSQAMPRLLTAIGAAAQNRSAISSADASEPLTDDDIPFF